MNPTSANPAQRCWNDHYAIGRQVNRALRQMLPRQPDTERQVGYGNPAALPVRLLVMGDRTRFHAR